MPGTRYAGSIYSAASAYRVVAVVSAVVQVDLDLAIGGRTFPLNRVRPAQARRAEKQHAQKQHIQQVEKI